MKLWFKAKQFGWGWYPYSVEGWMIILCYLVLLFFLVHYSILQPEGEVNLQVFIPGIVLLTAALLVVCYKTGETPRWRWGG